MSNTKECTLTDSELTEKVEKWVTDLCNSRGEKWCLCVPADHNPDPDFLFVEAVRRMNRYASRISELEAENTKLREAFSYYTQAYQSRQSDRVNKLYEELRKLTIEMSAVEAENKRLREEHRWIPVTERLPETSYDCAEQVIGLSRDRKSVV